MTASFRVEGLKNLAEKLVNLHEFPGGRTPEGIKLVARAGKRAFKPVEDDAKALVRVGTGPTGGTLRDNIHIAVSKQRRGGIFITFGLAIGARKIREELEVEGGTTVTVTRSVDDASWRWHFIELGTSHSKAYPFLRPAFDRNVSKLLELFKVELSKSLNRALKKQNGGIAGVMEASRRL